MLQKILKYTGRKIRTIARSGKKRSLSLFSRSRHEVKRAGDGDVEKAGKTGDELRKEDGSSTHQDAPRQQPQRQRKKRKRWDVNQFHVDPAKGKVRFHDLDLPDRVMHAIADQEFKYCTPIQEKALPELLQGKDLIGRASTGTGKSAVFLISIFTRLIRNGKKPRSNGRPFALIIAPTRELVMQIAKDGRDLAKYTPLSVAPVYGGVDYAKQMQVLKDKRCDVIVATPGRLLDFLGKNLVRLDDCQMLVIDEADRMLDMGFIPDVRRIIYRLKDKKNRQTMLFSATITEEVQRLSSQWCKAPVLVEIEPEQVAVDTVEQIVYMVTSEEKYAVLYNLIMKKAEERIIVFVNQKNDAKKLQDRLLRNEINCTLLSGDVPQKKRMQRLENFRSGKVKVLVATDVAGRGIHIAGISHVVNYTLPYEPEDYVHRIGRTGRAGAMGTSISFACEEGSFYLPQIEEFIGEKLDCMMPEDDLLEKPPKGIAPPRKTEGTQNRRKPRKKYRARSGNRK